MINTVLNYVLPASYSLLPAKMNSPAATAMVLAIGLQETRFLNRRQLSRGPARGFWQFEGGPMSGLAGLLTHKQTKAYADQVLEQLRYPRLPALSDRVVLEVRDSLEHNDILAAAFARLLLWTVPVALPQRGEAAKGWMQYLEAWRPGEPRHDTWDALYAEAWDRIDNPASQRENYGASAISRTGSNDGRSSWPGNARGDAAHRHPQETAHTRRYRTH